MINHKFNQPFYELHFSGLKEDAVRVLSFEGEEQLSSLFEYRIKLVSEDPALDSSKILNNNATFILNRGEDDPIKIHGIISNFEQYGKTPDYVFYKAVLVPHLWRLNLIFQNEVYQNMNIEDIIEDVLSDAGLSGNDYKIDLKNKYSKMEYVVQYRESNFNFLNRRLEHFGIFYYFEHDGDKDKVVFTDSNSKLPNTSPDDPIGYNQNVDPFGDKETLQEIYCQENVVTGMVQLKDYNYMFPEKQLMAQSQIDSKQPGYYYDYGDNFENEKDAESLAKVRNQELLCKSKIFTGIGDCRFFRAGYKFKIEKHYRDDWNAEYILTKVTSRGTQQSLFALLPDSRKILPTYENNFDAIPFDIEYRPPRKTPIPRISGIMSAKIESGSGDEYAFIDDHGRYRAKMLFDISDKTNGEATLPIRLSQSYSGTGYGIHFPNHKGTELIWACVDGNVDRPIGLGTIPNPSNSAPTVNNNKSQNLIRTAAGNEIILDDKTNETQIGFTTTDSNKILLDDKDDKIAVSTKDKYLMTFDDKNENIKVQSKNGHLIVMDDKNEKIEVQSKNGHKISIDDGSGGEKITLVDKSGENTVVIDISNKKVIIKTDNGNIDMHAPNGTIDIKATELNIETTGDTKLKAANINFEAQVDYKLKATNVTEEAQMDFKMKGMNVEAKGDMNVKVEGGMNFEAKGGMAAKVEGGAMADFKAGAKATIQAGIVMIN
jgi:type VI secretion system secreted protein VgrG